MRNLRLRLPGRALQARRVITPLCAASGLVALSLLVRCGGDLETRGDDPAPSDAGLHDRAFGPDVPDAGLQDRAPGPDGEVPTPRDASAPLCVPGASVACACTSGAMGAQLCLDGERFGACVCDDSDGATAGWEQQRLAWLQAGIVGTWAGTVQNPWQPAFQATLVFEASGHYSAHSPDDSAVVFYYGTNDDSPVKTYEIFDVTADGEGWGEIAIYFGDPNGLNVDDLRHVALSSDQKQLSFESWHQSVYGPIVFTLTRQ